jgi:hypothetical protein
MTGIYLDVKSTAPAQEHIQRMIGARLETMCDSRSLGCSRRPGVG